MKVELNADETWALMSTVVFRLLEDAGLADEDRAAIQRWRSQEMRLGSEEMKALTAKINEDLARALASKERSAIRKPDWV